jgi:hypothetical protein
MDFDDRANIYEIQNKVYQMQHKFNLGDILIFNSSEKHYIGVCFDLCQSWEIKQMMNFISDITDYRFTYVYGRDGYNALRIIPKLVDNRPHREIKLYDIMYGFNTREKHLGLYRLFFEKFNEIPLYYSNFDGSGKNDLTIREYETINW